MKYHCYITHRTMNGGEILWLVGHDSILSMNGEILIMVGHDSDSVYELCSDTADGGT